MTKATKQKTLFRSSFSLAAVLLFTAAAVPIVNVAGQKVGEEIAHYLTGQS